MTPQSPFARLLITLSLFINVRPMRAFDPSTRPFPSSTDASASDGANALDAKEHFFAPFHARVIRDATSRIANASS
jgi:hypothetical protein